MVPQLDVDSIGVGCVVDVYLEKKTGTPSNSVVWCRGGRCLHNIAVARKAVEGGLGNSHAYLATAWTFTVPAGVVVPAVPALLVAARLKLVIAKPSTIVQITVSEASA